MLDIIQFNHEAVPVFLLIILSKPHTQFAKEEYAIAVVLYIDNSEVKGEEN